MALLSEKLIATSIATLFALTFASLGLWLTYAQPAAPGQPAACAGGVTVLVNGQPLSTGCVLNILSGNGILAAPKADPAIGGTDLSFAYNSALVPTHDQIHAGESFCQSLTGNTQYHCNLPDKALSGYTLGLELLLDVDTTCVATCSLSVDQAVLGQAAQLTITQADGMTPPNGTLIAGEARRVWFDGKLLRLE